jgi:predicted RNase H-like nuclease (RuvC/YqgF family)
MSMIDMYRVKKKRAVDPNAPPRPNLLNHEKRLKEATLTVEQQAQIIQDLKRRVESLESKLSNQTSYLSTLHAHISRLK